MLFSEDMRELLEILEKHDVKYMLVGGHAVNYYGYIRTTQDMDLLIYPSTQNSTRIMAALDEFGFGGAGIPQECFEKRGSAVHLGVAPNRIDLLTHLKGIDLDKAFDNTHRIEIQGKLVNIISLEDLIETKRCSDRLRDRADAEELLKAREIENSEE
jgi:predicted nucleotidyltransferase